MASRTLICVLALVAVLLAAVSALQAAPAPIFDCTRATTAVEKSICGSAELASIDTDLAVLFGKVRDRLDAKRRSSLLAGQRKWLALREVACPPSHITAIELESCLQRLYGRRLNELKRQGALLDEEATEPKAPRADIDTILDAKRELAAYSPADMSAMHLFVEDKIVEDRVPQSCRELNALVYGDVWQYGTDNIGMNSQAVAAETCEYALQEANRWPSSASTGDDARFDDITKYSWEWANLTGVGEPYEGKEVRSFARELKPEKIKPSATQESCAGDDDETLFFEAGKADRFCFGGWTFFFNKRVFGDFSHRGREEALMMVTIMPSGPVGTYRTHGLWIAFYDPATGSIRPEPLREFFADDPAATASGGAATAIAPDIRESSPRSPR
jgi:uncharacterized protein